MGGTGRDVQMGHTCAHLCSDVCVPWSHVVGFALRQLACTKLPGILDSDCCYWGPPDSGLALLSHGAGVSLSGCRKGEKWWNQVRANPCHLQGGKIAVRILGNIGLCDVLPPAGSDWKCLFFENKLSSIGKNPLPGPQRILDLGVD